jgi:RNA polymerase sigma-70 factor, ECF subfamily
VETTSKDELRAVWQESAAELARLAAVLGVRRGRLDDVLQDVYLAVWQQPPAIEDPAELRRWLFRVTTNRCHLEHRRNARWRAVFRKLVHWWKDRGAPADAAETAEQDERRELVRAALARLDPRLRSILVLRYYADFDSRQIGEMLDLPDSTVRSHLRRARQMLAAELKREPD